MAVPSSEVSGADAGYVFLPSSATGSVTSSTRDPEKLELAALDGVRGLSALVVVVGHILTFFVPAAAPHTELTTPPPRPLPGAAVAPPPSPPAFLRGAHPAPFGLEYLSAVTLFFVVSGFTLVTVYEKPVPIGAPLPLSTPDQRRTFVRRRIARLAPVYVLGLVIGIVPYVVYTLPSPVQFAFGVPSALLCIQSIVLYAATGLDGPLWTVSALAICYALFPRLLASMRRRTYSQLRIISVAMACLSTGISFAFLLPTGLEYAWILHFFVGFRIPQFVLGMAAALMTQRRPLRRPVLRAELCSFFLLLNFAACALITAFLVDRVRMYFWLLYCHFAEFALPGLHAAWLSGLASPGGARGPSARLLSSTPLRKLGDVSYALYCTHFPVLVWACWAVARRGVSWDAAPMHEPNILVGWYEFQTWAIAPLVAVCLAVATLAHAVLEKPARSAIAKRGGQEAPAPDAALAAAADGAALPLADCARP
jgi:peptidoglycan/LPS O-acetylase OafA/YrhL